MLNGELGYVSESFSHLAGHLNGLDVESRQAALDAFLSGLPEGDAVQAAILAADIDAPPPEAEMDAGSDPDGWEPLGTWRLPSVEAFPVDVLPEPAARLVTEGAESIGCPPDFLGVSVLVVAAGTIGRSASLLLKDGYFAPTTVYAGCIGPPSDGKTPALKAATAAVRKIDGALEAEYGQALERWQEEAAKLGANGKKQKPPPPPKPRRIDVDDITMEALPILLADNPRGLVMIRDELTALVLGMNQFKGGKGNDRSNVLKIWSGDAIKKDRVNHENNAPIRCPHPCLSIVGGLPPDMLGELLDPKGRADGFLDRFLLTYPDPRRLPPWSERGVSDETAAEWHALVARLWQRPLNLKEGRPVPHVAHFTPEGKACWQGYFNAHVAEMNRDDFPPTLRGPWGKFRDYAGRLCLVLALMDHAADPDADPVAVPNVGPKSVRDGWRLVAYFKSHARRVQAAIGSRAGIGGGPVVAAIVEWIRAGRRLSFTRHEVKQARRWIKEDDLDAALRFLVDRKAIRPGPAPPEKPKGGRPVSPSYDVNPALLDTQNPRNPQNPGPSPDGDPPFEGFEGFEYQGRG
jgi:hypothetical protein